MSQNMNPRYFTECFAPGRHIVNGVRVPYYRRQDFLTVVLGRCEAYDIYVPCDCGCLPACGADCCMRNQRDCGCRACVDRHVADGNFRCGCIVGCFGCTTPGHAAWDNYLIFPPGHPLDVGIGGINPFNAPVGVRGMSPLNAPVDNSAIAAAIVEANPEIISSGQADFDDHVAGQSFADLPPNNDATAASSVDDDQNKSVRAASVFSDRVAPTDATTPQSINKKKRARSDSVSSHDSAHSEFLPSTPPPTQKKRKFANTVTAKNTGKRARTDAPATEDSDAERLPSPSKKRVHAEIADVNEEGSLVAASKKRKLTTVVAATAVVAPAVVATTKPAKSTKSVKKPIAKAGPRAPKGNSWSDLEHQLVLDACKHIRAHEDKTKPVLRDTKFWNHAVELIHQQPLAVAFTRTASACRLYWSRFGRALSGFDERHNPRVGNLTTCAQVKRRKTTAAAATTTVVVVEAAAQPAGKRPRKAPVVAGKYPRKTYSGKGAVAVAAAAATATAATTTTSAAAPATTTNNTSVVDRAATAGKSPRKTLAGKGPVAGTYLS